ncbi:IS630 family transposase [Natrialbaceae archaeon AArc-T1-2]|uniref:IS630 family transposase n=1 Tax=Natrialbaceae archaeon AArc-T1-2 TaxID=3053904 RepID=UPI00255B041C|nr:IS630 family transposase [Natrialbaceae archaeon AArc-T1-2]WIV66826.1 IS630 family transposase [Natrialbaceae archaeon AArc-T1-2]WIV67763.1 IS630 family transposase [Natrialbaceae archaeon AArc-T1-2]WIV68757.1 IS630 family transposase [Natrialbaceae archaeon AArc-T1-2]
MDHLDDISVEELHDALDNVEGRKPTQRLLAAIAYKNGVTQTELAEWHNTGRRTIYSWLKRLDTDESLEQAVTDAHRSGRKRKLSEKEQQEFEETVHRSPEEVGFDAPAWTPALVQQHLAETYDVEYSIPSCRRLLKEAGLSFQKPRRTAAESDAEDQETFREELKKKRREMDATVVCIDQTKKSVQVEPRAAWFPRGTRPSVELSGQRDWTCLLGAITEDGDRFFSRFEEYVTADHAKHFILALCQEFEDDLIIVLDGAPYFRASAVTDLAARDDLAFVTLPAYSPELNPVEECWRQLQAALSNRFFDSLNELTTAIDTAIDQLSLPEVSNYF